MKIKNMNGIALIAVLLIFSVCSMVAVYAIVKNIPNDTNAYYDFDENDLIGVKCDEKEQNDAAKAAKSILGSNIKLNVSQFCANNDIIVCYTKNMYIELDRKSMHPIFIFYECRKSIDRYNEEKCNEIVKQFVLKNAPRGVSAADSELKIVDDSQCVLTYEIILGEKLVAAAVRRDTGKIVYYDAKSLFSMQK